jgi:parallel beta-helix repeat protein
MKRRKMLAILVVSMGAFVIFTLSGYAGKLEPSGPPGPTMKTLDEVEPRIPLSPGNTPGSLSFKYIISQPGSYYLTENISIAGEGHAIRIEASDVTLDLKGFTISGSNIGSYYGIYIHNSRNNVEIKNGIVQRFKEGIHTYGNSTSDIRIIGVTARDNSSYGIYVNGFTDMTNTGGGFTIQDCLAEENGSDGIFTGDASVVEDCVAKANVGDGIEVGDSSTVTNCSARYNDGAGFTVHGGSTITNCSAGRNDGGGILCLEFSCTVTSCTVVANDSNGITAPNGSIVTGCTARGSGNIGIYAMDSTISNCTATFNVGDGIYAVTRCTIKNCTVTVNTGDGIEVEHNCLVLGNTCAKNGFMGSAAGIFVTGEDNRIEANNVLDSDRGIDVDGVDNLIIKNSVTGTIASYPIVPGNHVGEYITNPGQGFTKSNPWANFYWN